MTGLLQINNTLKVFFAIAVACSLLRVSFAEEGSDAALITSLQGNVALVTPSGHRPLQAFVKLKRGDLLSLASGSRLQVVFFESGRQEVWQGSGGRLEISATSGTAFGLPDPEVRILPGVLVKQLARTPALDSQGRAGVTRLRSIATPEAISKLENTYRQMRMEAMRGDLNPELYLLSGLYEMRLLERVEQTLGDLQRARPGDVEVGLVASLYQKAIRNARESKVR